MLYYHSYTNFNLGRRKAPSYTFLWCVAFSFAFTPVLLFAIAHDLKFYFPLWQFAVALSFLAVLCTHLSVEFIYPKWLQENW